MSYFGNQGPRQDGGFISGISRGASRLQNAKDMRARHAKSMGAFQLGATVNSAQLTKDVFLDRYGEYLIPSMQSTSKFGNTYWITASAINLDTAGRILERKLDEEYALQQSANPDQGAENLTLYAKKSAKQEIIRIYQPLFEAAGYTDDELGDGVSDSRTLAQHIANRARSVSLFEKAAVVVGKTPRAVTDTVLWDPSEDKAVAEWTLKEALPKNIVQWSLAAGGIYYVYRRYTNRGAPAAPAGPAQSPFFAVWS